MSGAGKVLHLFPHSEAFLHLFRKIYPLTFHGKKVPGIQPKIPPFTFHAEKSGSWLPEKRKVYKMFKITLKHSDARLFYNLPADEKLLKVASTVGTDRDPIASLAMRSHRWNLC